jgi:hypothetical protein
VGDAAAPRNCDQESVLSIRLARPGDLEPFCDFLRDVHVRAEAASDDVVQASISGSVSAHHARRELVGYVRTWNALNPASQVKVI